jgi:hypothetical protein
MAFQSCCNCLVLQWGSILASCDLGGWHRGHSVGNLASVCKPRLLQSIVKWRLHCVFCKRASLASRRLHVRLQQTQCKPRLMQSIVIWCLHVHLQQTQCKPRLLQSIVKWRLHVRLLQANVEATLQRSFAAIDPYAVGYTQVLVSVFCTSHASSMFLSRQGGRGLGALRLRPVNSPQSSSCAPAMRPAS